MITLDGKTFVKRKHKRWPIVVLCDIARIDSKAAVAKGCVLNFSRGGASIVSTVKLPWQSSLCLKVDGLELESLAAQVANIREVMEGLYAYGLEFQGLTRVEQLQIEREFKKLTKRLLS